MSKVDLPAAYAIPILDHLCEEIAETLSEGEVRLSTEQGRALLKAAWRYLAESDHHRTLPRPKQVRRLLSNIERNAAALSSAIQELNSAPLPEAGFGATPDIDPRTAAASMLNKAYLRPLDDLLRDLCDLQEAAQGALRQLPKDLGGDPGDPPFADFVVSVHDVFKTAGGTAESVTWNEIKQRFEGPFFLFFGLLIELAIAPDAPLRNNPALGKAIQRALSNR